MGKYDYDIITIGLGPAGMAVSVMASEMGLKVCAIEKHNIGGECMNVGCIPSKALLRMGKARGIFAKLEVMELSRVSPPEPQDIFGKIRRDIQFINKNKTVGMFKKVEMRLGQGEASFVDRHTVEVGGEKLTARRIFIAAGTRPMRLPIPGIDEVDFLTNENLFELDHVPESLTIIGGGAIGCEMAQAFTNLGTRCTIVHMDEYLLPHGDPEGGKLLEEVFEKQQIRVFNGRKIEKIEKKGDEIILYTDRGEQLVSTKLLMAAGRKLDYSALKLENAGVRVTSRGAIEVNKYLQTSQRNIFAVGDCNGYFLLSHAAMHQGMIAIMNTMLPWKIKRDFRKFVVPWTVFTDLQVSFVGLNEKQLKKRNIRFETIKVNYEDYGAAIAENVDIGYVKVLASPAGKIYGVGIVGEGSGEMINEWALAIQKKIRLHDIMLLQHSFPTMGFLSKRAAETWMMKKMESPTLKKLCSRMFGLGF
ncbi:MAG: NAD(P)/FAD-dependent oxidoreductase [Deltaproteobacteria bacterium]|nr:NAD(P)/FAD-dependent oxidoreductase [Deltaproteobacteria bacterium]